jgi:hypothetical protein
MTNPSSDPIASARYIFIGEMLNALQNAKGIKFGLVTSYLANLMTTLDHVGLPYPKTNLDASLKEIEEMSANRYHQTGGGVLPEYTAADLCKLIVVAHETITGAAESRLTIALDRGGVSTKLRSLPQQLIDLKMTNLNPAQTGLHAETTRCLECGANRSAAVMGWNMAFDYIRQWVFDNHLAPFNAALTANYVNRRNGNPIYDPITDYADFLKSDAPGERIVLDTCNSAGIITGNVCEDLKSHLRQRNSYAHPSGKEPTAIQVNAYLEYLVDLISGRPFNVSS